MTLKPKTSHMLKIYNFWSGLIQGLRTSVLPTDTNVKCTYNIFGLSVLIFNKKYNLQINWVERKQHYGLSGDAKTLSEERKQIFQLQKGI